VEPSAQECQDGIDQNPIIETAVGKESDNAMLCVMDDGDDVYYDTVDGQGELLVIGDKDLEELDELSTRVEVLVYCM